MEKLDVTVIEPRLKHPTIFERFDALQEGEAFVIHNDHDPKPLYYQLIGERGEVFEWEYLLNGPEIWEVKISKLKTGETSSSIGELVASDYRKAEVFRKYGLDFCCGGKKTIKEACEEKGLDAVEVEKALKAIETNPKGSETDVSEWDLDFLADYIVNTHHKYVYNALPMLDEFTTKVAKVHGNSHPETILIKEHYDAVANELRAHMPKEEQVLFPAIKQMVEAAKNNTNYLSPGFGSIKNPINMMEAEHLSAGENIEKIRELSDNFTPPIDACSTYRVLFNKLEEFEHDLHRHIHLENNVLFKKAIALEEKLLG